MIAEQWYEADGEHDGHEEYKDDVKVTKVAILPCTTNHLGSNKTKNKENLNTPHRPM